MGVHDEDATENPLDEYRIRSYRNWEAAAPGWDRNRRLVADTTRPLTRWLLDACAPQPGETVLELAAGAGELSLELAALVAPGGRVICTDRSPRMVEFARTAASAAGLRGVECLVADAEHLELADASVDAVCCRLGYMLMPDPGAALAETARVLRPGGRAVFVVWDAPERNPWAAALWDSIDGLVEVPSAPPGGPGMFALADRDRVRALLAGVGLGEVDIEDVPMAWEYTDFDEFWRVQTSLNGSLAQLLPALDPQRLAEVRSAVAAAAAPFVAAGGRVRLPGQAIGVRARSQ